jgi:cytoskeletal protein RodZ
VIRSYTQQSVAVQRGESPSNNATSSDTSLDTSEHTFEHTSDSGASSTPVSSSTTTRREAAAATTTSTAAAATTSSTALNVSSVAQADVGVQTEPQDASGDGIVLLLHSELAKLQDLVATQGAQVLALKDTQREQQELLLRQGAELERAHTAIATLNAQVKLRLNKDSISSMTCLSAQMIQ